MNFRKKLKIRLWVAISYIILGAGMIAGGIITRAENNFVSSFGFALLVIGIVRIRNHLIITRSEERIRKQEILESDERNISIANRAKSITFSVYTLLLCLAVIILSFLKLHEIAMWLSASVFVLLFVYWISYFIIRKKS